MHPPPNRTTPTARPGPAAMRKPTKRRSRLIRGGGAEAATLAAKRRVAFGHGGVDAFDRLPDDLVLAVLAGLAARAGSPADLAAAAMT